MRIAVDAMGGDFAPKEIVAGTIEAARQFKHISKLYLVGDEDAIRREYAALGRIPENIEIRHAGEVIGMEEAPAVAIRRKKDSSIGRAVDLVKAGEAEAVFSAGSTGAAVAASALKLRTLEGVERPAIAVAIPSPTKPFVLVDAGATTDCTPKMLLQFALMGSVYSKSILKVEQPVVGLLSIGGEDSKGNEITKESFQLLEKAAVKFYGNVEGHDLFEGNVDVVVCDGFVGNVVLKTCESVAHAMKQWLKEEFTRNVVRLAGAMLLRGAVASIKKRSDPRMYGGAPLLGVNGVCIIAHGASSAHAIFHAVRVAQEAVASRLNEQISREIAKVSEAL
jgi:glycerol-3-phosphate acyltransferase PlsX